MKVKGYRLKLKDPSAVRVLVWRVYGTKEVARDGGGRVEPKPDTWDPVFDLKCDVSRGVYSIPEFDLEYTRPGGWRFYRMIGEAVIREDRRAA